MPNIAGRMLCNNAASGVLRRYNMNALSIPQDGQAWLERRLVESQILKGNRAGESHIRPLTVYMPKEASDETKTFPVLYCLAPWTSAGRCQFDWQPFKESLRPPDPFD